ncbi:hypothetical protein GE09DRAFT_980680 [Coniochaeta sp. 2T2.1]|nr:hypothetical protein GE09DRAFT_980680 [Coniochaeta sp. 2T2.1]
MARLLLISCMAVGSWALDTVKYGAFLPTATYSIANQLGFFEGYNLDVVYNQVPNSTAAFSSLLGGQYDILTATVDNALNYRFNQNQDVTVLGQLDQGPDLVLVSVPSIVSIAQLEGKPIIVDSPVSGYAYLLRKMLSGVDYSFMTVGGTQARYSALLNGSLPNGTAVYATILNYPFTKQAAGLNILARVSDVVVPITSSAFTVGRTSAPVTRFVAAMYAANMLLQNPRAKACSIRAIAAQLGVARSVAASEYASATDPLTGEVSGGNFTVNPAGIMNDVLVRQEFGGFVVPAGFDFAGALVPGAGQLIDYSIRDAAVALYYRQPVTGNCTVRCK